MLQGKFVFTNTVTLFYPLHSLTFTFCPSSGPSSGLNGGKNGQRAPFEHHPAPSKSWVLIQSYYYCARRKFCYAPCQLQENEDTKEKRAAAALEAAKRRHPLPKSYLLAEEGPFEVGSTTWVPFQKCSLTSTPEGKG
eukprot:102039-Pelagomonas_calceolata.AAC.7